MVIRKRLASRPFQGPPAPRGAEAIPFFPLTLSGAARGFCSSRDAESQGERRTAPEAARPSTPPDGRAVRLRSGRAASGAVLACVAALLFVALAPDARAQSCI